MAAFSSSHTFQGNHIGGQARVHMGDHHGDNTNNETHHHYNDTTTNPGEEERKKVQRQAQSVLTSLNQEDPSLDRQRLVHIKGERAAGTCEWVLKDDKFQSLVRGDSSTLWISGGPGLGKTVLSVYLTEYLESNFKDTADVKVVYYFCNYLLRGTKSTDVLRALLWQILQEDTEAASSLFDRYFSSKDRKTSTLSAFVPLWAMLEAVLQKQLKHQRYIFVLDGLDECDQESVLDLSTKLANVKGPKERTRLQTMVVSRDIPRLRGLPRIRLDPDYDNEVRDDVKAFIAERVASLSYLDGYNETFQDELQELLLERAAGTFLWIGFAMTELSRERTCYAVLQAATSFPSGLDLFYTRMLHQVGPKNRDIVAHVLQWVALAYETLKLGEIAEIIDLTTDVGLSKEQAARDIVAECGPLLRIAADEIKHGSDGSDRPNIPQRTTVDLVHQSARDYLLRAGPDDDTIAETFRIVPGNAHLDITRSCLAYLQTKVPRAIDPDKPEFNEQYPLFDYARFFWIEHAKHIPSDERLLWRSQEFYRGGVATQRYWYEEESQRHDDLTKNEIEAKYRLQRDPLTTALWWGIKSLVETILEDAKSAGPLQFSDIINGRFCPGYGIPIYAAIYGEGAERQEMFELLLSQGADVNARRDGGITPLHGACSRNDGLTTIKLLVDAGAEINARDYFGHTPLDDLLQHSANRDDEVEIARIEKLLRSHGAKRKSELQNDDTSELYEESAEEDRPAVSEEKPKPRRLIRFQKKVFGRVVFGEKRCMPIATDERAGLQGSSRREDPRSWRQLDHLNAVRLEARPTMSAWF